MTLAALLTTFGVGGAVGFASGLLGIGGGVVIVPFLYVLFQQPEWSGVVMDPAARAAAAHATSLAVIIPTSLAGLRVYHRAGQVEWPVVLPMGLVAALAAVVGAGTAVRLPGRALEITFAGFLVVVGTRLLFPTSPPSDSKAPPGGRRRRGLAALGGGAVGYLSALLGVGGGVVAIPYLLHVIRMEVRHVAAASIGVIAFAAPAGSVAYAIAGGGIDGLAPGTIGYIFAPAAVAMLPGAVVGARIGARLNQKTNLRVLGLLLALLLLATALRLIWSGAG